MYLLAHNQQSKTYPYSVAQLQKDNPQTSFPTAPSDALLASYNVFPVSSTDRPAYSPATHRVEEGAPALVAGTWVQVWNVVPLTAEEAQQYLQELQDTIIAQTQQRLDDFARTRGYDGVLSACSYATSGIPKFATEGQRCVELRDATWVALYQVLTSVQGGTHPMPTGFADIEGELPALIWSPA